jgi:ferredoxin
MPPSDEPGGRHRLTLVLSRGERTVEVRSGASLLSAIVRARLPLGRSCRGRGVCGACRVVVVEGSAGLTPPDEVERALLAARDVGGESRYACRVRVIGEVTLTTTYW